MEHYKEGSSTFIELLRWRAENQPDKLAYQFLDNGEKEGFRYSYSELDKRARSVAAQLQRIVKKGDRAILVFDNDLEYIAVFYACLYAGIISAPLHPPGRNKSMFRISSVTKDAHAEIILTASKLREELKDRFSVDPVLKDLNWISTDEMSNDHAEEWKDPDIKNSNIAFLQYTSGSTGSPKGVMVTHDNLLYNIYATLYRYSLLELDPKRNDSLVTWAPLFHDLGLIFCTLLPLYGGFPCYMMTPEAFIQRPIRWLETISKYGSSVSGAPNFAYELLANRVSPEEVKTLNLSTWDIAMNGSEPVRADTLEKFAKHFAPAGFKPHYFSSAWGQAETTIIITTTEKDEAPVIRNFDKESLEKHKVKEIEFDERDENEKGVRLVGHTMNLLDAKSIIVDPKTLARCKEDQVGEIWVSGTTVTPGYYEKEKANKETFAAYTSDTKEGPFLRTGDLGFIQGDQLFITGRYKDLIIIRGQNHYPQDIELTVERSHPALRLGCEAAFSVDVNDDEQLIIVQEINKKFIEKEKYLFDPDEVCKAIRKAVSEEHNLNVYHILLLVPGTVRKTSSGKIQRNDNRNSYLDETLSVVAHWKQGMPKAEFIQDKTKVTSEKKIDTGSEIKEMDLKHWLINKASELLQIRPEDLDLNESFASYGMDSLRAVQLSGDLSLLLKKQITSSIVYNYPSVNLLLGHLENKTNSDTMTEIAGINKNTDKYSDEPIAVIGMSCRFPGADNINEFSKLLFSGKEAIKDFPADNRWDNIKDHINDGNTITHGGYLNDIDKFDPQFFGISPREATQMDPQQRLLLEVGWEALEDACIDPDTLRGKNTGVFMGVCSYDYARFSAGEKDLFDVYTGTGTSLSIVSNRLSYLLDLRGPSISVDTACSSSLVAIHQACNSIRSGESSIAIAGGVSLLLSSDTNTIFTQTGFLSKDGKCKTFDADADGYVRGEGCGVVILKSLTKAVEDGDRIIAVIKGSAVNQDGKSNGLTAPNGLSQEDVIRQALFNADSKPADITYIEAHGTGTPLGDPIEVNSITEVLKKDRSSENILYIGSVKTNIGHLEGAAGIAGVIKTILALKQKEIPKHLNFNKLNAEILIEGLPVKIVTEKTNWTGNPDGKRIAGVSSFGFGGTNAHVILEEAPEQIKSSQKKKKPFNIFTISAKNEKALQKYVNKFEQLLSTDNDLSLEDICYSANTGRAGMNNRLAITVSSKEDLIDKLKMFLSDEESPHIITGNTKINYKPKVAYLFPGQGAQYTGMCKELYDTHPLFRNIINECDAILRNYLEKPLLEVLFYEKDENVNPINETTYTQPALFAVEYALGKLWMSWGIVPELMMGHSAGEYVAACLAGVFSLEDGLKLTAERGQLMQTLTGDGEMYTIFDNEENTAKAIREFADPKDVSVASINSPVKTVISGKKDQIAKILPHFDSKQIEYKKINVSIASHSSLMEPMIDAFRKVCNEVTYSKASIPVVSNITAEIVTDKMSNADYWCEHIMSSVRFSDSIKECVKSGIDTFMDLGPMPTSIGMAQETIQNPDIKWLASIKKNFTIWETLLQGLGELYVKGFDIDFESIDKEFSHNKISLPEYPFQRQRYWIEDLKKKSISGKENFIKKPGSSLLGKKLSVASVNEIIFSSYLSSDDPAFIKDHGIYGKPVFPTTAYAELAFEAGLEVLGTDKLTIEELLLHKAFLFEENSIYNVQIILTEPEDKLCKFEIYSSEIYDGNTQTEWSLNVSGRIHSRNKNIIKDILNPDKLRTEFKNLIDTEKFYAETRSSGIEYDGNFKILKELYVRDNISFAFINATDELVSQFNDYQFHPVMMDACLHTVFAPLLKQMNSELIYLPIGINSINIYGKAEKEICSLLEYDIRDPEKNILNAKLKVFSTKGDLIAEAEGIQMKKVTKQDFLEAQDTYLRDWLYEVVWEKQEAKANDIDSDFIPGINSVREKIVSTLHEIADENHLSLYKKALDKVELLSIDFTAKAFEDLGFDFVTGRKFTGIDLYEQFKIIEQYRKLFGRLFEILEDGEIIKRVKGSETEWEVINSPKSEKIKNKIERLKIQGLDAKAEMDLLIRCGSALADILTGKSDPLQLLFPDGDFSQLTELYERSPAFRTMNSIVKDTVTLITDKQPEDKTLKILEIGAGTGATTSFILNNFKNKNNVYCFTDVSQVFLTKAKDKFKDFNNIDFRILDIEKDPAAQGFPFNEYDIIIASNVIHATKDLKQSLANVKKLLKNEGLFILTEATERQKWVDLVFGLTEGWWRFEDKDIRPEYALLNEKQWKELFSVSGFGKAEIISVNGNKDISLTSQSVILIKGKKNDMKKYLICSYGNNPFELLNSEITSAGSKSVLVNSEIEFLKYISSVSQNETYDEIIFISDSDRIDSAEFSGCGVNYLLQILHNIKGKFNLTIVTNNARHVTSEDTVEGFSDSPLWGFGKVISIEHPELNCKRIDLDGFNESNAKLVFNETNYSDSYTVGEIAFRKGAKFFSRLKRASSKKESKISVNEESAYLIAGGTKGLGLLLAKYLAYNGAKHLALISRGDIPEESKKELDELKSGGVEVNIFKIDITEKNELKKVIVQINRSGHPLKGIIQSAGVLDDGAISNQTKEKFDKVLKPKIQGTLNLSNLTDDLDFFIMFSSIASVLGSAGQANHSAANAFLDSFAYYRRAKGLPALTINWGVWSEIGSAANIGADKQEKIPGLKVITPETGLKIFDKIFRKDFTSAGAFGMNWKKFTDNNYSKQLNNFISALIPEVQLSGTQTEKLRPKKINILEDLKNSSESDHKNLLTLYFRKLITGILGLRDNELDPDVPLNSIGLDSLMAIELKNRVNIELGVDLNLVRYMESTNIFSLADELKEMLVNKTGVSRDMNGNLNEISREVPEEENARMLLENIDNLSEEEIEKLLNNG